MNQPTLPMNTESQPTNEQTFSDIADTYEQAPTVNNEFQFIRTICHMPNVKRWTEFSPHFVDTAAAHSYRTSAYTTLAVLQENKQFGGDYDALNTVASALLRDVKVTLTGSIKHRTKHDPLVKPFIQQFEKDASRQILGYLTRPHMSHHFVPWILSGEATSKEAKLVKAIDTFSSMMYCYRETQAGSNPFFQKKFMELYVMLKQSDVQAVRWMMQAFDDKGDVYEFFEQILVLSTVERWNTNFNLLPDDDASHTYRTAALALYLACEEIHRGKTDIDLFRLLGKTLFHDLPEAITGDIKGPLKHSTPEAKASFEKYEEQVAQMMVTWLPESLQPTIHDFMVEAKDGTYMGHLVDAADKLDALVKANLECSINPSYKDISAKQNRKVNRLFEDESIRHFLDEVLDDVTLGVD